MIKKPEFLHVDTNSWKLNADWNILGEDMVKNGWIQPGVTEINWFMVCWHKFGEAKSYFDNFWVVVVKNGSSILQHFHETLNSPASQEWIDLMSWFFAFCYKFRKAKNYFNNHWVDMVKNGCGYSGVTGLNWFMACWYKFGEAKSYFNNFWVVAVKDGCGNLWRFQGTLKSAASQEWIVVKGWFFACWCKFGKAKSYFNNYWMGKVKNGRGILDHETPKSGILHK